VYCFGRWYRTKSHSENNKEFNVIGGFKRILKFLSKRNLKIIPFRLSTMIDPFQPMEETYYFSRRIMSLCLKYEIPLIINTKATLLSRSSPLLSILRDLGSKDLVIVQISLSTINAKIASVLEPNAPLPMERLDSAEKISRENIPVIIRLQPFIPGITDYEVEDIIMQSRFAGVKQIIVESLRDEIVNMKIYEELAYEKSVYANLSTWDSYSPSVEAQSKIIRPSVEWRLKAYIKTKNLCEKYGLTFSTCKEGFYDYHTARNCCGMHYLGDEKYLLRPTLYEYWNYYEKHGRLPSFDEFTRSLTNIYLFGDGMKNYPRLLRKRMLSHEKILREVVDKRRNMIKILLPTLQ